MKETSWDLPRAALRGAGSLAHKGCDFLVSNPGAASLLGPYAAQVQSACGMLKAYQVLRPKKPRPLIRKRRKRLRRKGPG